MLGLLVAVFALERNVAVQMGHGRPDTAVLVTMGGVSRNLVASGQIFRLFTAPLLHVNMAHLVSNSIVFLGVGLAFERLLGPVALCAVFSLGGLAGTLCSVLLDPPAMVSVGASGAIMAIVTALLVAGAALPPGRVRTRALRRSAVLVILGMLPAGHGTVHVDYAAHFGGGLLGAAYGLLLLLHTCDRDDRTWLASAETMAAAGAAGLIVLSACTVIWRLPARFAAPVLIPDGMLPQGTAEVLRTASSLRELYPRDPRSHMFVAMALLRMNEVESAERELRLALDLAETAHGQLPPTMGNYVRGMLAVSLAENGRTAEARDVARKACDATGQAALPPHVVTLLWNEEVCVLPAQAASISP